MENKYNLPFYMVNWLTEDDYDSVDGVISATLLLKPTRATALLNKAKKEGTVIDSDVSYLMAARYGTMIHDSLSSSLLRSKTEAIIEKRFFAELAGYKFSGKPDAVIEGVLHDFKSTSTYKWVKKDYDDYIKQLSIYRWLLYKNDVFVPEFGVIDFIFTDWSRAKAIADSQYPQFRYAKALIHLWKIEETENWITERMKQIEEAEKKLPFCTESELWAQPPVYAHMRPNRKSAVKLYDTKEQAAEAVILGKSGDYVEFRSGRVRRCEYCNARSLCGQYESLVAAGRISKE